MTMPFGADEDPAFTGAVLEDEMARLLEGLSNNPMSPNEQVAPNPPEDTGEPPLERQQALIRALYGSDCPLADDGAFIAAFSSSWTVCSLTGWGANFRILLRVRMASIASISVPS